MRNQILVEGKKQLTLAEIVELAGYELAFVVQWSGKLDWIPNQQNHIIRAQFLISMVETMHCGSVGGYAPDQRMATDLSGLKYSDTYDTLFARWLFLEEKYLKLQDNDQLDSKMNNWYSLKALKKFYRIKERP